MERGKNEEKILNLKGKEKRLSEIGKQLNFKELKMTYAAVIRLVRMGKVKRMDVGKYVTAI